MDNSKKSFPGRKFKFEESKTEIKMAAIYTDNLRL